jgi:uncharacterized membrane protein
VHFGLILGASASSIAMLARTALGLVILDVLVPIVTRRRSSFPRTIRRDPESNESLTLDALWELYKRGEISWDEYLRGKIEGRRGLIGVEGARGLCPTKQEPSDNAASSIDSGS